MDDPGEVDGVIQVVEYFEPGPEERSIIEPGMRLETSRLRQNAQWGPERSGRTSWRRAAMTWSGAASANPSLWAVYGLTAGMRLASGTVLMALSGWGLAAADNLESTIRLSGLSDVPASGPMLPFRFDGTVWFGAKGAHIVEGGHGPSLAGWGDGGGFVGRVGAAGCR